MRIPSFRVSTESDCVWFTEEVPSLLVFDLDSYLEDFKGHEVNYKLLTHVTKAVEWFLTDEIIAKNLYFDPFDGRWEYILSP